MAELSFFWHDYETFGREPRRHRPAQFAGVRTDAELREIEAPQVWWCQPPDDALPEPEACLLTGIVPQDCLARGVPEHTFAANIESQLARPGTIGVGYNSIRFDDEVTRFLFWRCLIDPYAREWQHQCGRWDLLDVLRCAWALRPEGIEWPLHDDGRPSFKLEHLTRANGIEHDGAHEALSDVRATLAMARLLKARQPRLWDFCLRLRHKDAVRDEIAQAQSRGQPLLHISGMYGTERGCTALVWPLAPHPKNRNELIVWDLAHDPGVLLTLDATEVRQRLFSKSEALPAGVERLPIKTIHLNKSPVVIANLRTLQPQRAIQFGLDMAQALRHAETAARDAGALAGLWPEVVARPAREGPIDVDEDLYGGFLGPHDRRICQQLLALSPQALADKRPAFEDPRLDELLFRYRARNFRDTLQPQELEQWRQHVAGRLLHGAGGQSPLSAYEEQLRLLGSGAEVRERKILDALSSWGRSLGPG
ncbi:MAG: exodeoxyribonuclease I [Rubrivivax sp.]